MIKFFRQSYAIQYVVIALLAVALWLPAFISGKPTAGLNEASTPLFNLMDRLLCGSSIAQHSVAFALLILDAFVFNAIMVKNQIVGKVGTMGAFVFVLLSSLTLTQTGFYPFVLSTPFILLTIGNVYDSYVLPNPELKLLQSGALIALASFCYFPSIILVLWTILAIVIAKRGTLRFMLIPLFGFLFVYFVFFACVYLFGDIHALMCGYIDYFNAFHFSVEGFNRWIVVLLALLVLPTVFMFFGNGNSGFEKTATARIKISTTLILSVFAFLTLFFGGNVLMHGLLFIVLSVLMSYLFSYLGNTGWANLYLVLILVLVFANLYYFKLL